ncbi:MAG: hypothetical protein KAY22_25400 [Rhizorhabdus sp.]|uniref:hypothetical protein n=1 Tax=Rhizorhabdus sp. TaxID=1968843 RepID=UPI001B59A760|nr:hypothetical protein [Rhizorhabdus sp.]MBP8235634.1 hypothetical protein [Rhizorhabdus sp.]
MTTLQDRQIPRDLVECLRIEARNAANPPTEYLLADDGGRMVHKPKPDFDMAELLDQAANRITADGASLARLQAELARTERNRDMWKGQCERQAEQLAIMRQNLTEAVQAVELLPMDCMGVGGRDDPLGGTRWYIRDELLANCRACLIDHYDDDDDDDPEGLAFECAGFNDGTGFYCPLWGSEECDWECPNGGMG